MRHSDKSASRATRRSRCHKARQTQARRRNRWQPAAEQARSISLQLTYQALVQVPRSTASNAHTECWPKGFRPRGIVGGHECSALRPAHHRVTAAGRDLLGMVRTPTVVVAQVSSSTPWAHWPALARLGRAEAFR